MFYLFNVLIFTAIYRVDSGLFDRYSGKKVDVAQAKELQQRNATERCSIDIKPCTPHEGSRIDGTCNNYKYPTRGSARGPYLRLLKPDYANDRNIRMSRHGSPLPSARKVRTELHSTGRVEDKVTFSAVAVHMLQFIHRDISFMDGPFDYLKRRQYCCQPKGDKDPRCIPIAVPDDDPYLKVTDIRCLNFSRAETFQDASCTPEIILPEQINYQTPVIDLSTIYGVDNQGLAKVRKYEDGLLILEKRENRFVPATNVTENVCLQNNDTEPICYQFGFPEIGNYDLRTTALTIFFMREHNRLAKALHEINPCWKDDRLFKVARQINIATASNIFMYELLPYLLGYRHMVNYGLLSESVEHVSNYDAEAVPLVYAEYDIAVRYINTFLDGRVKTYSEGYHYKDEYSYSETLFRSGLLEKGKVLEELNRGMFHQYAAKIDDIQDPDISENYYGKKLQRAHDLPALDIQRGRDMGVRGYNDYRRLCGLKPAKKFRDFIDVMEIEKVEALKKLYHSVDDVDLLAGIMSENDIQGIHVGPTLFCIMTKQLQIFRFSDRFWFERGDQLHSFTIDQLDEIRKTNMARFACDNADGIKYIQPQAFLNVRPGNMPAPCSHIEGPDLTKWRDRNCHKYSKYSHEATHMPMSYKHKATYGSSSNTDTDFSTFFDNLLSYRPSEIMMK
ncbi:peroxidase-like [Helicoverpa zea]|uniref:peroxidase-like n=1 Tax=Helicoverpa zea TaxID=7113 RepID=UPI001F55E460|nr:peroxidase-like [Helicoverpa zea]